MTQSKEEILSGLQTLDDKIAKSKEIIGEGLDRYELDDLAVAWTGGKDSTLLVWLVREVCRERSHGAPVCFCIDEGDMFDEMRAFLDKWSAEWGLELHVVHNEDVSSHAEGLGAPVTIADLDEENQYEARRVGWEEDTFFYEPESLVGNHLMKTVAMNRFLREHGIRAFFEGIRWDEQGARAEETYFSDRPGDRYAPEHARISPLLHVREREIWGITKKLGVPYCELYEQGFRSLGARVTTRKTGDVPAWEQDLESAPERVGRRHDKGDQMENLRKIGYM
ncbi:MAG: phosphoadenosine phosphosulfate reductase family protein [Planctomycetota bacterium]